MSSRKKAQPAKDVELSENQNTQANGNGEISVTFAPQEWMTVLRGLSQAAGHCSIERNYEQMFQYNGVSNMIGQRLGIAAQTAGAGDSSPPLSRAAGA